MQGWEIFRPNLLANSYSLGTSQGFLDGHINATRGKGFELMVPPPDHIADSNFLKSTLYLFSITKSDKPDIVGEFHCKKDSWDLRAAKAHTTGMTITRKTRFQVDGAIYEDRYHAATAWPTRSKYMEITPTDAADPTSPLSVEITFGLLLLQGAMHPTPGQPGWYRVRLHRESVTGPLAGEIEGDCFVSEGKDRKPLLMMVGKSHPFSFVLQASAAAGS